MRDTAVHYYEFGSFCLDVKEQELRKDGKAVPLNPKAFSTLLILVERCGSLVEKEELMSFLWPNSFVEESSISQNISVLRKTLGEKGRDRQFIETIPKRGYRFVATVREVREAYTEPAPDNSTQPALEINQETSKKKGEPLKKRRLRLVHIWTSAVLLMSLIASLYIHGISKRENIDGNSIRIVAVLPFKALNQDEESRLLGLGLTDALIIKLGKLNPPTTLPTSAVLKYAGQERDARAIGKELGVDAVLEGTVQRSSVSVRVTGQLIGIKDGKSLWSGSYDGQMNNLFTLQDNISDEMADALYFQISGNHRESRDSPLTKNKEAYEAYIMGLYFWSRRSKEELEKAMRYFEQAVKLDPNFAQAFSLLADCYYLEGYYGYGIKPQSEALSLAKSYAQRAIELDDGIAEAHIIMAGFLSRGNEFDKAEAEYRHAIELSPNLAVAHVRFGNFLFIRMRLDEALPELRRAQELDPSSYVTNAALCLILYMARNYDEALKYALRAYELAPAVPQTMIQLGDLYIQKGMFSEANKIFHELERYDSTYARVEYTYLFAVSGEKERAERMLSELLRRADNKSIPAYAIAVLHATLGNKNAAFKLLFSATFSPPEAAMIRFDPQLDPLRLDRRYEKMMKNLKVGQPGPAK